MSGVRDVISFFYPDSKTRMGEIIVDAFINETHTFSSEITEHPIESGGTIVDHVYQMPLCLSIDGIISNTPMSLVGLTAIDSAVRFLDGEGNIFALQAYGKILDIFSKREPIGIATSLVFYDQMVLESLSIERGGGACEALRFSCTAKQIRLVHQERIKIPEPKVKRAKPKQNKGQQETKPIPEDQAGKIKTEQSALYAGGAAAVGAVKGVFGW